MATVPTTLKPPEMAQHHSARLLSIPTFQCFALVVLLVTASVIESTQLKSLGNATSWLQLQAGHWIVAHRAVPHSGILSQSRDLPWTDPNWGLQLSLGAFSWLVGVRALPVTVMILQMLFALATFILAGGRRGSFWLAILISMCAQIAVPNSSLPTVLCSATFFSVELFLLLRSRASRQPKLLWWIPLLILVWVNLDWRFVLGVTAFCLFCGMSGTETWLQSRMPNSDSKQTPGKLGLVAGLTGIASLASPNFYHSYVTAWQNLFGTSLVMNSLAKASLTFREPQHYLLMALAMCAFLLLGRRRGVDFFQLLLLTASVSLGFFLGDEGWIIAVASVAVIGESVGREDAQGEPAARISVTAFGFAVGMTAIILLIAAVRIPSSPEVLLDGMAGRLPVRASDFVRKNHLPGPIYNELEWGGFLSWYLPEYPAAIDDRYELYGELRTGTYYAVTKGLVKSTLDPTLIGSNTIVLSISDGIVRNPEMFPNREEIFGATFPGFHEVYRDDQAVVLTRQ